MVIKGTILFFRFLFLVQGLDFNVNYSLLIDKTSDSSQFLG